MNYNTEDNTLFHVFIAWISKENCLDMWLSNSLNPLDGCTLSGARYAISHAFKWRETQQGHDFWKRLNIKWTEDYGNYSTIIKCHCS